MNRGAIVRDKPYFTIYIALHQEGLFFVHPGQIDEVVASVLASICGQ